MKAMRFPIKMRRSFTLSRLLRCWICLIIWTGLNCGYFFLRYNFKKDTTSKQIESKAINYFLDNMSSYPCLIPEVYPWNKEFERFWRKETLLCQKTQPFLTVLLGNGTLQWNYTEVNLLKINTSELKCWYQGFWKFDGSDDVIMHSQYIQFTGYEQVEDEFLEIFCIKTNALFYSNLHVWVPTKRVENRSCAGSEYPNVHIFCFDSMSRANFIRQLPKTYDILINKLKAIILKGLITVGPDTLTNLVPLLTGKRPYFQEDHLPECCSSFYDSYPFVWKIFSEKGYVTGWMEDSSSYATFNYLAKGFQKQPTDYYMRPFWVKRVRHSLKETSSSWCFGNVPNYDITLQWLTEFIEKFNSLKKPFFLMNIYSEASHGYLNTPQQVDDSFSQFIETSFNAGNMNNTIFIFMGDHGVRFGPYSESELGHLEMTLPFFSISLPPWLKKRYPHLIRNLETNRERLTTFFDVYDALMDIINQRWDKPRISWSRFGRSVWYPVPHNRSCLEAGVPSEFCPCNEMTPLFLDSEEVTSSVDALLKHINDKILPYPKCAKLGLKKIITAKQLVPYPNVSSLQRFYDWKLIIYLIIETSPNNARFEAIAIQGSSENDFKITNSVNRLNSYDAKYACVQERTLKDFCFCKTD